VKIVSEITVQYYLSYLTNVVLSCSSPTSVPPGQQVTRDILIIGLYCRDSVSRVNMTEADFEPVHILVLDRVGLFFWLDRSNSRLAAWVVVVGLCGCMSL